MESAEVVKGSNEREGSAKPPSPPSMAGYNPNRIPSSVFSPKSGTEWSATSSDSLFSIQMGNSSFSNDYAIMYGKSGDFDPSSNPQLKSGELPRLEEWSNNNRQAAPGKSSEVSSLPPVMEHEESSESSSRAEKKEGRSPHGKQSPPAAFRPPINPMLNPRISDVSAQSSKSFAFPVLVSDSGKKEESVRVGESRAAQAQEEQPHKPNRWFSCFSCARPRCC